MVSSSVGGFAVHFGRQSRLYRHHHLLPAQRTYRVLLCPAKVIDHTEPFYSVIAELNAAGPYGAVVDTIGLPPVTVILSQVLTEKGGQL